MQNAKADASLYILCGLLQRLELKHPGLLQDMIEGVKTDQSSTPEDISKKNHVKHIFNEVLVT